MFSCEGYKEIPNLTIGNRFADGWLTVKNIPTGEMVTNETLLLFGEKTLFLDLGVYQARLVADQGVDPYKQDRLILVNIPSEYCQIKILFE